MSWGHINQHGADGEPYFSLEEPEFSVRDGFVTVVQQFSHGIFFNMKDETLPLVTNSLQAIGSNTFRYARNVWPSFIGNYELAARVDGEKLAGTPMEINVYESNVRYDELYHELMEIKGLAEAISTCSPSARALTAATSGMPWCPTAPSPLRASKR